MTRDVIIKTRPSGANESSCHVVASGPPAEMASMVLGERTPGVGLNYRVTGVPDGVGDDEVVRRFRKTAIWGAWEVPFDRLHDGVQADAPLLTPKTLGA